MSTQECALDVLVVDDDPDQIRICSDALAGRGFLVRTAGGVLEALAQLAARRPQLVLLDLVLPDGSGWELVAAIRASSPAPALPIIVLSARDLAWEGAEPMLVQVQSYLTKPCDPLHLEAVLRGVLLDCGIHVPASARSDG